VPVLAEVATGRTRRDVSHREECSPNPERRTDEPPPGSFVSDELESDCSRFLEEIKEVVRRRIEAGLSVRH
jgi:hypothetical protein